MYESVCITALRFELIVLRLSALFMVSQVLPGLISGTAASSGAACSSVLDPIVTEHCSYIAAAAEDAADAVDDAAELAGWQLMWLHCLCLWCQAAA